jgi:hypothetical protein
MLLENEIFQLKREPDVYNVEFYKHTKSSPTFSTLFVVIISI